MAEIADKLAAAAHNGPDIVARRAVGERPNIELQGDNGTIVSRVTENDSPDWVAIFELWGLNPDDWHVDEGSLKVNAWEMAGPDGELRIHRQFKANIRRKAAASVELEDILKRVKGWKRPKKALDEPSGEGHAFVVNCSDWQIGGEGGTDAAVERLLTALDEVEVRAKEAVAKGATMLVVCSVGDIVEGVVGNYPNQPFTVDLDLSGQVRVARHVMMEYLKRLVPLFETVKVAAVRGNHGQKGKETTPEDNADLDYIEGVAEVCAESEWGSHITFHFPPHGKQSQVLIDACGTNIFVAHGDEVRGKAESLKRWIDNVCMTRHADADLANIYTFGHRHHLRVEELSEDKWLFQCPAMDGGSRWFSDIGGGKSLPSVMVYSCGDGTWWDMHLCRPTAGIVEA